jgi:hypothetical protein
MTLARESLTHFFFECSAFNHECHALDLKMGRQSHDLAAILSSEKGTQALLKYVNQTSHFKHAPGEILNIF